jgi:hypothetical protein
LGFDAHRAIGAGAVRRAFVLPAAAKLGADRVMLGATVGTALALVPVFAPRSLWSRICAVSSPTELDEGPADIDPDPPPHRELLTSRYRIVLASAAEIDQQGLGAWI